MKSLKDYINDREMRRTGGTPESADFHSKGYHRYFEGYSEYKVPLPNGKTRIERIYTGVYHRQNLDHSQRRWIHTTYCILWGIAAILFLYAVTRYVSSNTSWYVAITEAFSVAGLFWMLCNLFNYITASTDMTINEFRSVAGLKKSSRTSAVFLVLTAVTTLLYTILHPGNLTAEEVICMISLLLASASCLAVFLIENRLTYSSFLSKNRAPENSNQISS